MTLHTIICADCQKPFQGCTAIYCGKCRRKGARAGAAVKGHKGRKAGEQRRGKVSLARFPAICPHCEGSHLTSEDNTVHGHPGRVFCPKCEYLRGKDNETNSVGYW